MDLDINVAVKRFKEFLPGRDLSMNAEKDDFTRSESCLVSYIGPEADEFNDKLEKVLGRFGWGLKDKHLDKTAKRMYLTFSR